jgi:hypothetical protein
MSATLVIASVVSTVTEQCAHVGVGRTRSAILEFEAC